jgi:hypothetical protein
MSQEMAGAAVRRPRTDNDDDEPGFFIWKANFSRSPRPIKEKLEICSAFPRVADPSGVVTARRHTLLKGLQTPEFLVN